MDLYYGFDMKTWLLIGIIIYSSIVLLVVMIRQCIVKNTLCPFCICDCIYLTDSCELCSSYCMSRDFCCSTDHNASEPCCFQPSCTCRCFLPDCSYSRCICCELTCESRAKVGLESVIVNVESEQQILKPSLTV